MADNTEEKKPEETPPASDDVKKEDSKPEDNPASDSDNKDDKASDKPEEKTDDNAPADAGAADAKPDTEPASPEVETTTEVPSTDAENPAEEKTEEEKKEEALEPLASEVQAKEEEVANLELVYDKLQKAKEEIQATGAISQETMVSMETMFPGIMTDNYPNGGYNLSNLNLAIEGINFKQTLLLGGIIAAVIGVIVTLLRLVGLSFERSSTSSTTAKERVKETNEKMKEKVEEIKTADKVIDELAREVSSKPDLSEEAKKKFITDVNDIFGTDYPLNTNPGVVMDKTPDIIIKKANDMLSDIQNNLVIELHKSAHGINGQLVNTFIKYNTILERAVKHIEQVVKAGEAVQNQQARGGVNPAIPKYERYDELWNIYQAIPTQGSVANLVMFNMQTHQQTLKWPKVVIRDVAELMHWNDNLRSAIDAIHLSVDPRVIDKMADTVQKLLDQSNKLSLTGSGSDELDRQHFTGMRTYWAQLQPELRILREMNIGNDRVRDALVRFNSATLDLCNKHFTYQRRVLHLASNAFTGHPELKKHVDERIAKLSSGK